MGNHAPCCCLEDKTGTDVDTVHTAVAFPGLSTKDMIIEGPGRSIREECPDQTEGLVLKAALVPPPRGLMLGFRLPDESLKEIVFKERPFGMKFSRGTPITVTEVQPSSHAHDLNVQVGWILATIEGDETASFSTDAARVLLRGRSKALPFVQRS
jgi:hypothetical protein